MFLVIAFDVLACILEGSRLYNPPRRRGRGPRRPLRSAEAEGRGVRWFVFNNHGGLITRSVGYELHNLGFE